MVALTHWVCILVFLRTAGVMATCHSVVFRRLVHLGSFSACWWHENVTTIPKGPPPSSVANYRLVSITSVLSKMFQRLRVCSSWMIYGTQWGASNHPVCLSERSGYLWCTFVSVHTLQDSLESGHKARIVQIDITEPWANHQSVLYRLCSVSIGSRFCVTILIQFLYTENNK